MFHSYLYFLLQFSLIGLLNYSKLCIDLEKMHVKFLQYLEGDNYGGHVRGWLNHLTLLALRSQTYQRYYCLFGHFKELISRMWLVTKSLERSFSTEEKTGGRAGGSKDEKLSFSLGVSRMDRIANDHNRGTVHAS